MLLTLSACLLWGILPLYWKQLLAVPALEITCHRVLWCLLITSVLLLPGGKLSLLLRSLCSPPLLLRTLCTSTLLGANWLTYVWAVNADHVVEASLGYFINPLVTVLLGVLVLKEQIRPGQWFAMVLALCGVLCLTFAYGRFPWIALCLALSFSSYSLLRKTAALQSLEGLFLDMLILALPGGLMIAALATRGCSHFLAGDFWQPFLLAGTGLITALPLLLFVAGTQRLALSLVGMLQYVAPTLQLFIGVFIYAEPFPASRLMGFSLIWVALALFTGESLRHDPEFHPINKEKG
ncbi:MAG: protein RarD [Desulfobulbus propionicus]|nr:MAG: protein RarD [Desulfobulbus propionicus]